MENHRKEFAEKMKKNLQKGYSEDSLKYALLKQGYSMVEVMEVLEIAKKEIESGKKLEIKEKPQIKYEYYDVDNKPIREPLLRRFFKKFHK